MLNRTLHWAAFTLVAAALLVLAAAGHLTRAGKSAAAEERKPGESAPAATARDLAVDIVVELSDRKTAGGDSEHTVLAYVMNVADHPVRIYIPGFAGPVTETTGPIEAVPFVIRDRPSGGGDDYVVLQPYALFGHFTSLAADVGKLRFSAVYEVYEAGHEGNKGSLIDRVQSHRSGTARDGGSKDGAGSRKSRQDKGSEVGQKKG